jgi:hypothetical protein
MAFIAESAAAANLRKRNYRFDLCGWPKANGPITRRSLNFDRFHEQLKELFKHLA